MREFKLSSGLWEVKERFKGETVKEAWNYLREKLKGKYVTLYEYKEVLVFTNNYEEYNESYNRKYAPKPIGHGVDGAKVLSGIIDKQKMWIPILQGVSDDEFDDRLYKVV